tara:strand:+ start:407 stop:1597 length:1191 start_codon:yes stop_codon:yes gene_type:complete
MNKGILITILIIFATFTAGSLPGVVYAQYIPGPVTETVDAVIINNSSQVLLKGEVRTDGNVPAIGYFEYGRSRNLGNRTPIQQLGSARVATFSYLLNDLREGTLYYYRAVAENTAGATGGAILTFRTGSDDLPPPVTSVLDSSGAIQPTQPVSSDGSLITYIPQYMVYRDGARVTFIGFADLRDTTVSSAVTWFEWGSSPSLGNGTSPKTFRGRDGEGTFKSDRVSGFDVYQTYYVRARAQDKFGTYYGNIVSFTLSDPAGVVQYPVPPVQSQTGTQSGTQGGIFNFFNADGTQTERAPEEAEGAIGEDTSLGNIPTDQIAIAAVSSGGNGVLPESLFGWVVLSIALFVFMGLIIHIGELYKKLKTSEKQNGNGGGPGPVVPPQDNGPIEFWPNNT